MSAIGGILKAKGQIDRLHLQQQKQALSIHGPDSSGIFHSEKCGLISNLRHFTPEDPFERQPLTEECLTIVADVRLDNREDLLSKLGLISNSRCPVTDTALILYSFRKWGRTCLDHLVGAFAFAIWNDQKDSLFLARDQRGEKTVFYHESSAGFAFASMPKGLFVLPWIERRLNERKLAEFLVLDHSDHTTSFFQGVHRLPPAHFIEVKAGQVRIQKYWEFDLETRIFHKNKYDYVEQGRELLEKCIKSNLRSSSPVGAMMSGGLDSSIVACIAADILGKSRQPLPTFTEVPSVKIPENDPHRYFDETPYIMEIAAKNLNIEPHFVNGLQKGLFEGIQERLRVLDAPYRNPFNQLWLEEICEQASQRGSKVLLTGQSGNMTLSYHGLWQLPKLLYTGKWRTLKTHLTELKNEGVRFSPRWIISNLVVAALPGHLYHACSQRSLIEPLWANHSAIESTFAKDAKVKEVYKKRANRPTLDSKETRSGALPIADFIGEYNQQMSTTCGVELRDPLGDMRFAQWTFSIPESVFIAGGQRKFLAKAIGRSCLPSATVNNTQKGLQAADWAYHFHRNLDSIKIELEKIKRNASIRHFIDFQELEDLISKWTGPNQADVTAYRFKLTRALVIANFVAGIQQ